MVVRITTEMLFAVGGGGVTAENVGRVRRILEAGGVEDVELHALEVAAATRLREQARLATASADRILASGPLPEHACEVSQAGRVVIATNDCPVGCNAGGERIKLPHA